MALAGGPADKLGNSYELWWTVRKLIDIVRGEWEAIRFEQPGMLARPSSSGRRGVP